MTPPALRPLTLGEILDTGLAMYRELFGTLIVISVVCSGLPVLVTVYINTAGGPEARPLLWLGNLGLSLVLGTLASAGSVRVISGAYLGRPLGAAEALQHALPLIGQLIVLSFLSTLVIGLGFFALLVPGFIFLAALLVSTQALVLEPGLGATSAMGRSWSLTRGYRWRMLGLLSVFGVIAIVATMGLTVLIGLAFGFWGDALGSSINLGTTAILGVVQLLLYPILYCLLTVAYYDLRVRREGFDLELLASALARE